MCTARTWGAVKKQARAGRWVPRGVESGGGSREVGRYIAFFSTDGSRVGWLQKLDRIGSNGVHGVVVVSELVSVEMAKIEQTYQLLIARHRIGAGPEGKRPPVESVVLFRGIGGRLPQELVKQGLIPEFFTRAGEVKPIPDEYASTGTGG